MNEIQIIILTKSSKHSGYCVAGVDVNTGEFYRIVTEDDTTNGALAKEDLLYENNKECQIFDEVVVPVTGNE